LNSNIALIYRNYDEKFNINLLADLKEFCKINKRKFFLSNNIKLALKLNLDGAYIPSFNNDLKHRNYKKKKDFILLGSANGSPPLIVKCCKPGTIFKIFSTSNIVCIVVPLIDFTIFPTLIP